MLGFRSIGKSSFIACLEWQCLKTFSATVTESLRWVIHIKQMLTWLMDLETGKPMLWS